MADYPRLQDAWVNMNISGIPQNAVTTQFPYSEVDEWVTAQSKLPCGVSVTHSENETPMKRFRLVYAVLTKAEVVLLENFFVSMRGRYGEFNFKDDAGTDWFPTRFDMDALTIKYGGPGQYNMEVLLLVEPASQSGSTIGGSDAGHGNIGSGEGQIPG